MKSLVEFINESISDKEYDKRRKAVGQIEDLSDFYELMKKWKWDKKYPYAVDGVGYFVYGDKSNGMKDILDARGEEHLEDDSQPSAICLNYENSWYERIEDLDDELRNMKKKNGETVG